MACAGIGSWCASDEITSVTRTKEYFNDAAEPKSLHILEVCLSSPPWPPTHCAKRPGLAPLRRRSSRDCVSCYGLAVLWMG